MYQQNQDFSWSDRQPTCRHSWRRHHGGSGYDECGQQQDEGDSVVARMHKRPTVCYYTADDDLTHEYVEMETDSCLTVASRDFEAAPVGQELEDNEVWMEPFLQTEKCRENIPGRSRFPADQRMNEVSEVGDCLCPCKIVHPNWGDEATNVCMCLPPPCFNVRKMMVVGVEVDVVEEFVYEDTEILQTQTVFDGSLENHMDSSSSSCCNHLFLE